MDQRNERLASRIVSVNVSPVREVRDTTRDGEPRLVRTGIFKRPVEGSVDVGRLNLAGDDQADRKNHGGEHKAVYAFGQQHLPHWREALSGHLGAGGADAATSGGTLGGDVVGPGFFGENLSIDTLDETALRVGDRLRAGSALLEITQPRVPCFKQGIRAGVKSMPRLFVRRGRTGAYLRVIEEGRVSAGDALVREERGTVPYTLAELFAAVYGLERFAVRTAERRDVLETALECEALSGEWRAVVTARLGRLDC